MKLNVNFLRANIENVALYLERGKDALLGKAEHKYWEYVGFLAALPELSSYRLWVDHLELPPQECPTPRGFCDYYYNVFYYSMC